MNLWGQSPIAHLNKEKVYLMNIYSKLAGVENRFEELSIRISDPSVIDNQKEYTKLIKEFYELEPIVGKFREYKACEKEIADLRSMLASEGDKEFRKLLEDELENAQNKYEDLTSDLRVMLLPKDPNDDRSIICEIRAGAGGEEAALFAGVLFRMYSMYAERCGYKVEILDSNPTEIGGFKEIVFSIEGRGAYSRLKFESGVHRVQRVPETESQGRIHTSTVTVAVLPEVGDVEVSINPADIEIDTFRASGAGGQHVNKTDSAIRITHLPTGLVVTCQDERSQHKNKDKAMKILRSKLYEAAMTQQTNAVAMERKSQVGTGDRSERIRTYNYPQNRVSDHRINMTLYKLDLIINGDIDDFVNALIAAEQAEKLAGGM